MTTRYIVRADISLAQALADGLKVELVSMPSDKMDAHTKRLIDGA